MARSNRRDFIRGLWREGARVLAAFEEGRDQARQKAERRAFFRSYESSYALTLCEDELLMESARMAGIKTEGRDRLDIARELFEKQGEGGF